MPRISLLNQEAWKRSLPCIHESARKSGTIKHRGTPGLRGARHPRHEPEGVAEGDDALPRGNRLISLRWPPIEHRHAQLAVRQSVISDTVYSFAPCISKQLVAAAVWT